MSDDLVKAAARLTRKLAPAIFAKPNRAMEADEVLSKAIWPRASIKVVWRCGDFGNACGGTSGMWHGFSWRSGGLDGACGVGVLADSAKGISSTWPFYPHGLIDNGVYPMSKARVLRTLSNVLGDRRRKSRHAFSTASSCC